VVGATSATCQHRDCRGTQRHLGLAEADVADHQPIHRAARGKVRGHVRYGLRLTGRRREGEARREAAIRGGRRGQHGGLGRVTQPGHLDQGTGRLGNLPGDALPALRPCVAVEPIEPDRVAGGAVTPQPVEPLDRRQEVGIPGVVEPHGVARLDVVRGQCLQRSQQTHAMLHVDHDIAERELAVARVPRHRHGVVVMVVGAMGAMGSVAQEVGCAHHRDGILVVDEAVLCPEPQKQHIAGRCRDHIGPGTGLLQGSPPAFPRAARSRAVAPASTMR